LLDAQGFSISEAGALVSISTWTYAISVFVGGGMVEWSKRPNLVMAVSFLAMALALALVPYTSLTYLLFIAIGVTTGLPTGAVMALSIEALQEQNRSVGMGVFYAWRYAGFALMQPFAGWTADISGDAAMPVLFGAVCLLGACACLAAFRLIQAKPPATAAA
jgi:MFS family permease